MLTRQAKALTLGLLLLGVLPARGDDGTKVARGISNARMMVASGPERYAREMIAVGRAVGVAPTLLRAVVMQESSGNPDAVSEAGAVGLTQLMPVAIRQYAPEAARLLGRPVDARRALDNLLMGALYYRDALRRTGGNVEAAARRYHGGPNLALHGPRTMAYGKAVAYRYRQMSGNPSRPSA